MSTNFSKYLSIAALASTLHAWQKEDQKMTRQLEEDVAPEYQILPNGPAMIGFRVTVKDNVHLLLVEARDYAKMHGKKLASPEASEPVEYKLARKFPVGTRISINGYGTVTPVELSTGNVSFLTAAHVLNINAQQDICFTNRVISEAPIKTWAKIIQTDSKRLDGKFGWIQFPQMLTNGEMIMMQMPTILRYNSTQEYIRGRIKKLIGWTSGSPVVIENPTRLWEYGIGSIFPGGALELKSQANIGRFPKNEILIKLRNEAIKVAKKGWEYTVCQ